MDRIGTGISSLFLVLASTSAGSAREFVVDKTDDSGAGTLRQAIADSNAEPLDGALNSIVFRFGTQGVAPTRPITIRPLLPPGKCGTGNASALPEITRPVVIDGFSQNAWSGVPLPGQPGGRHLIEISGQDADTDLAHPVSVNPGFVSSTQCVHGLAVRFPNVTINGKIVPGPTPDGTVIRGLVINRFGRNGIIVVGTDDVQVKGNIVGLGYDETADDANVWNLVPRANGRSGIVVGSGTVGNDAAGNPLPVAKRTIVGSADPLDRNIFSANGTGAGTSTCFTGNCPNICFTTNCMGIDVEPPSTGAVIKGNYVGTNEDGDIDGRSPGTGYIGVYITTPGNRFGGLQPGEGNLVYGSGMSAPASGIRLYANPNPAVPKGTNNVVEGNQIYGNYHNGVNITPGATDNIVRGNFIGRGNGPMANGSGGIAVLASRTRVEHNTITGTGSPPDSPDGRRSSGIMVKVFGFWCGSYSFDVAVNNAIVGNSISGNYGIGIDIVRFVDPPDYCPSAIPPIGSAPLFPGADGSNPNVPYSAANVRANRFQNYPVLTSALRNPSRLIVKGSLSSKPSTSYRIELFSGMATTQGELFQGALTVTTDATGYAPLMLNVSSAGVPFGSYIMATATRLTEGTREPVETSEFSPGIDLDKKGGDTAYEQHEPDVALPSDRPESPVGDAAEGP